MERIPSVAFSSYSLLNERPAWSTSFVRSFSYDSLLMIVDDGDDVMLLFISFTFAE